MINSYGKSWKRLALASLGGIFFCCFLRRRLVRFELSVSADVVGGARAIRHSGSCREHDQLVPTDRRINTPAPRETGVIYELLHVACSLCS